MSFENHERNDNSKISLFPDRGGLFASTKKMHDKLIAEKERVQSKREKILRAKPTSLMQKNNVKTNAINKDLATADYVSTIYDTEKLHLKSMVNTSNSKAKYISTNLPEISSAAVGGLCCSPQKQLEFPDMNYSKSLGEFSEDPFHMIESMESSMDSERNGENKDNHKNVEKAKEPIEEEPTIWDPSNFPFSTRKADSLLAHNYLDFMESKQQEYFDDKKPLLTPENNHRPFDELSMCKKDNPSPKFRLSPSKREHGEISANFSGTKGITGPKITNKDKNEKIVSIDRNNTGTEVIFLTQANGEDSYSFSDITPPTSIIYSAKESKGNGMGEKKKLRNMLERAKFKFCRVRCLVIFATLSLLFSVTVLVILLTSNRSNKNTMMTGRNNQTNPQNVTSCSGETNIILECICQSEFSQDIPDEVSYNRDMLLNFFINATETYDDGGVLNQKFLDLRFNERSCSAANQGLMFVADLKNHYETPTTATIVQRFVLAFLYQSLQGQQWNRNKGWLQPGSSECEWEGIECTSETKHILKLSLPRNQLQGKIDTQAIGMLLSLRHLDLSHNPVTGAFPSFLTRLQTLKSLDLSFTDLSGTIPTELGQLKRFKKIKLSQTKIQGTLPTELGSLELLDTLDLSRNVFLYGKIPDFEWKSLKNLEYIDVSLSGFTGSLPKLWDFPLLEILRMNGNYHSGTLPPELGNLSQLHILDLSDNDLTGSIPDERWSSLIRLESLNVSHNELQGPMPETWKNWEWLETLAVNGNSKMKDVQLPEEPYGQNLGFVYLYQTSYVPVSYCTRLPLLDILRVDCDDQELTRLQKMSPPCSCCTCNYIV